jgi:glutathione synthase/RimK-type ligase-like ATP-grasp enzyme
LAGVPFLCQFVDSVNNVVIRNSTDPKFLLKKFKIFVQRDPDKRVLILSRDYDPEADYLGVQLLEKGIDYVRMNIEDIPLSIRMAYKINQKMDYIIQMIVGENKIDLSRIALVWAHNFDLGIMNFSGDPLVQRFSYEQWVDAIDMLKSRLNCEWINNPDACLEASNHLKQLSAARSVGLDIPSTLVTNDPVAAREFYYAYSKNIIVKALHHHGIETMGKTYQIYTRKVLKEDLSRFDDLVYAPCILQEMTPKKSDLRITVIGDKAFRTRINIQSSLDEQQDWHRYPASKLLMSSEVPLPESIIEQCIKIMKSLKLRYGAIDFVENKDGRLIFLEVNPAADWWWIERQTGQKITNETAELIKSLIS